MVAGIIFNYFNGLNILFFLKSSLHFVWRKCRLLFGEKATCIFR